MSLTRIDCHFFCRTSGKPPTVPDTAGFVTLNPWRQPGMLVAAGSCAVRGGIGSQVASRLALEHFVDGVLRCFEDHGSGSAIRGEEAQAVGQRVLEIAFKNANTSVYNFGHKLSAGGRLAAYLYAVVVVNNTVSAGRVGNGPVYLYRAGEAFPFFESATTQESYTENFVGAQSLIKVELASVEVHEGDCIFMSALPLPAERARSLCPALGAVKIHDPDCATQVVRSVYSASEEAPAFAMVARVGPEAIYLGKPVR